MALRIRRGTDAQRSGVVFESGELVWTTDGEQLWIGDGITAGGKPAVSDKVAGYGLTYNAASKELEVSGINTDDVSEGLNRKYYTAERAIDDVGAALVAGNATNIGITFTYSATEDAGDRINATVALDGVGITDLVNDTTPQLGGDLDLNGNDITGTGNVNITGTLDTSGNIETSANISGLTITGTTLNAGSLKIENNSISNPSFDSVQGVDLTVDQHVNIFGKIIPPGVEPDAETTAYTKVWVSQYNSSLDPNGKVGDNAPLYATVVNAHNGVSYVESAAAFFTVDGTVTTGASSVRSRYGIQLGDGTQPIGDITPFLFESTGAFSAPILQTGVYVETPSDTRPTGVKGMIIFNDTTGKFQGFNGTVWVDLN